MRITIESTNEIVSLAPGVRARVWRGHSEGGVKVYAFVASVAVSEDEPPSAHIAFQRELIEQPAPPTLERVLNVRFCEGDE